MALPTLDATFASAADLPRRMMLAQWLVNIQYTGSVADYVALPERYLWAKIAVAAGGPKTEADYISLPKNYVWKDIYDAVSGSSAGLIQWSEKQALGHIVAAYRGDTANPANLATYIDWPWRYQVASIIDGIDSDAQQFISLSGATDRGNIYAFVSGVKNLNLWDSMVCWPMRSSQNAGTGTTLYSLGGLGTYNGTLVNGPTWSSDGIIYDGSNDKIDTSLTVASTQVFCGVVGTMPTTGSKGVWFSATNSQISNQHIYSVAPRSTTLGNPALYRYSGSIISSSGISNSTSGVHMWSTIGGVGLNTKGYRNKTLLATAATTAVQPNPLQTSAGVVLGSSNGAYQGTAAFSFIIHSAPSNTDDFYELYKTTLGKELGLT
jgi:hypothetical protein